MNSNSQHLVEETVQEAKQFVELQLEYYQLTMVEQTAKIGGFLLWRLAKMLFFTSAFLFGSIAIAVWVGHLMNGYHWGFLAASVIYVGTFIGMYLLRRRLFDAPILEWLTSLLRLNFPPEK
jgi:hypothetical protein